MTIRFKLFAGFVFLIVIFVSSFYINYRLSKEVVQNSVYLNKSETVIRNSNFLHKLIIDMQSGYRGYLLTGEDAFLSTYYEGLKSVPPLIAEQRSLMSADIQKLRLDSIRELHLQWVEYANSVITTKRDTLPESSERYKRLFDEKVKTGSGKKLNDDIRVIFLEFDEHEYRVRQERRKNLQASIDETGKMNLILITSSIALGLLACFYIINTITGRIAKMVNLAEQISKGNFITLTERKRDELTRLSASLTTMSQTLEKNFKELTKKNKELDQFAYVVSHDLKAPLRGIDNITTWMEEDYASVMNPEIKKNLDLIKGRTHRLENMINGLLDYARIGKAKRDVEMTDVGEMLEDLCELLVPKHFDVKIGNMPVFVTEKIHLEQVFSNLVSNAVKYNDKPNGKIVIECKEGEEFYDFSVSDNGIGIQSQYFEKIFTIFQTLRERDAFESTGVGLAIVKRIVEDNKGEINVESVPGEWTTFRFTWPKEIQRETA